MGELWKGAPVAAVLNKKTLADVARLKAAGVVPTLAIVRVGARENDLSYERGAIKRCAAVGVVVRQHLLEASAAQGELLQVLHDLNADPSVHGVLLFRPLPSHMDDEIVRAALAPEKDVDGITDGSLAGVFTGSGKGFPPCTAQACIELLDHYGYALKGRNVTVVGRSLVVGKPVAMLLLARHATVTICHTRTVDMAAQCQKAELVVAAAGKAGVVDESFVSPHQAVVDVGINVAADGKLCGDAAPGVADLVDFCTPVPGGIGAVTTSVLVRHTVVAALRAVGLS